MKGAQSTFLVVLDKLDEEVVLASLLDVVVTVVRCACQQETEALEQVEKCSSEAAVLAVLVLVL
jgi:hypothetical protein